MRTVVLILNWNTFKETRRLLQSFRDHQVNDVRIIVVDNASKAAGIDDLTRDFPEAVVLRLPENVGYTGGYNAGIRKALAEGAELIVQMDSDTILPANPFPQIWEEFEKDPMLGVLGPAIYDDPGCKSLYCMGWNFDSISAPYRILDAKGKGLIYTRSVLGCFLAVNTAVYHQGILFDERLYNYYEETDFLFRVGQAGLKVAVKPTIKVVHTKFAATGAYSPLKSYYQGRNLVLFFKKHAPFGTRWYHTFKNFLSHYRYTASAPTPEIRRTVRRALREGFWDGLCGRFGRARRYLAEREKNPELKGLG